MSVPASGKLAVALEALMVGAGLAALSNEHCRAQAPAIPALVATATKGCFASTVRFTGVIVARAEAIVNLNMDGYQISEVLVAEGDDVLAGHALARIKRFAGEIPPPGGQPSAVQPSSAVIAQQQQMAAAQQQPANLSLTAPAAGRISRSAARIGDVSVPLPLPPPFGPEPMFRIIVGNELEVEGDVASVQLPKLKPGQTARIQFETGREMIGRVRIALPEVDRRTQLGKVRLAIESDPAVRVGMYARGIIEASHSCGVSIPRSAVTYRTDGATVQVLRGQVVEARTVRLGFFSATDVEVREGIREGEVIIANAGTSLHDGDLVKPISSEESGPTGGR
jgi:multidrug efflux pump subunit AcrA (membrane-fusion protein)